MSDEEEDEHIRWLHEYFKPSEYKELEESVFLDRRKFSALPEELPFQYENLQIMKKIFEGLFEDPPNPAQLVLKGSP